MCIELAIFQWFHITIEKFKMQISKLKIAMKNLKFFNSAKR